MKKFLLAIGIGFICLFILFLYLLYTLLNITEKDIEIYYHYRPSRGRDDADFKNFKKLDSKLLSKTSATNEESSDAFELPGLYNLRLPLKTFNKKGIYTIYIKPKEIFTNIVDVSTLASHPTIKGIVLNGNSIENDLLTSNGSLVGYRVEYFNDDVRSEEFRVITSNNHCEPVAQNLNDPSQKGVRYRFNESSPLIFCTLTPSSTMSFKSNSTPFIGKATQKIALINTKFEPIMMEIEMVEHDIETVSTMLEGDQLRNLETNTISTFNNEGGIYHQVACGTITDPDTNKAHDFKVNNEYIDFSEDISIVKDNL